MLWLPGPWVTTHVCFLKTLQYLLNQGPGQDPRTVAGPAPVALLKEAAAEGGSLGNSDCWEGLSSGGAWQVGKAGGRSNLQFTPLPLFLLQGTFGFGALEGEAQSSKSWKTRSSG